MIKAIIFDFDGLMVDTETPQFVCWREAFGEYGVEVTVDSWVDCIGRPPGSVDFMAMLAERSGQKVDREELGRKINVCARGLIEKERARPGVGELVEEAAKAGVRLGVASSSSHEWVEGGLERLGLLDRFDVIVCNEDTERHKPEAEPYLKALELLGAKAEDAMALEDSPHGITAAKGAGLYCVGVPNPLMAHLDLSEADVVYESLAGVGLAELVGGMG